MRRRAKKKTVYSTGEIWSDIDHRFVKDSVGALKKAVNIQAVYSSIDNILRTNKGERVMLPQFASDIHGMMFEPLNQASVSFLTKGIKDTIEFWDNRVKVEEISIGRDPDRNTLSIALVFMIQGYTDAFQYETPITGEYP